jgi:hypothetical protein
LRRWTSGSRIDGNAGAIGFEQSAHGILGHSQFVEQLPYININDLRQAIPRNYGQVIQPDVSLKYPDLKYPDLAYMRLSASCIEIMGRNGYVQRFGIHWIPTYFGKHRAIFVCSSCRGGAIRLFGKYGS